MDSDGQATAEGSQARRGSKVIPFPQRAWWRRLWDDPVVRDTARVGAVAMLGAVLRHLTAGKPSQSESQPAQQPSDQT